MKRAFVYLSIVLIFAACSPDDTGEVTPVIDLPSGLSTEVTINEETVQVNATATDARNYGFLFVEGTDTTFLTSTSGSASHTFLTTGTHHIWTRAYASTSSFIYFIEKLDAVDIESDITVVGPPTEGYTTPMEYPGYTLVWNDEFNGNSLSNDWTHEIGNGNWGWGNNELQYYKSTNTLVEDGLLKITAVKEPISGFNYSSSRIKTQGKKSFKYGRIDIRAALPYGQGIWPALWMLGESFSTIGWPSCGEIDIMELVGGANGNDGTVHGTLHWNNNGNHASYSGENSLPAGAIYAEEFHVFSIIWDQNNIRFFRDDIQYHVMNISGIPAFHEEFFFIFNVAVGGQWPGSPNGTTQFPQRMTVDYVRVFQQ